MVERIDPFLKTVLLLKQPEPKNNRSAELTITYAAFRVKERLTRENSRILRSGEKVLASPMLDNAQDSLASEHAIRKDGIPSDGNIGDTIWVVNASEVRNNDVMSTYVEEGINMWPILDVMESVVNISAVTKGTRYLLITRRDGCLRWPGRRNVRQSGYHCPSIYYMALLSIESFSGSML